MQDNLNAPFPWFGGKRRVADVVWRAFGEVTNFVEPFYGSGAVLLGRPEPWCGNETVNDIDGLVANFWRAIKHSPDEVAEWANWPVNENDLHARHIWLLSQLDDLPARLEGDPDWHDPKIAGWWVWGMACWIGGEFCSGKGPWHAMGGRLVRADDGDSGQGVQRQLVHLGNNGRGVHRSRPALGHPGHSQGVNGLRRNSLLPWFSALSDRLARVRVCSGDWSRVCGPSVTFKHGMTAVFLDPPYADTAGRDPTIYRHDSATVAHDVREWAIANGSNPLLRIALCGYDGEHEMPDSWSVYEWKANGGYSGQGDEGSVGRANAERERIWFSPACLPFDRQLSLLDWINNCNLSLTDA